MAANLALAADHIATTLDELAAVHEMLAEIQGHPLADGATAKATFERNMAAEERRAAIWFRSIATGTEATPQAPKTQRLPSQ